jgi:hypothetical protein
MVAGGNVMAPWNIQGEHNSSEFTVSTAWWNAMIRQQGSTRRKAFQQTKEIST